MAKPALRQEMTLLHEDLQHVTEQQYSTVLLHQLWEIEKQCRKAGFDQLAGCVGLGRFEVMQLLPELQATQPEPIRARLAPDYKTVRRISIQTEIPAPNSAG